MSNKTAELIRELGLNPNLLPTPREGLVQLLRSTFSKAHPSIQNPSGPGYEPLKGRLDRRIQLLLGRHGVGVVGLLKLVSHDDLLPSRASDKRRGIGVETVKGINAFVKDQEIELRTPSTSLLAAAQSAFGKPEQVPVEWLVFEGALDLVECQELLLMWGIRCLGDLPRIPRLKLLLLSNSHGEWFLDEDKLRKIQRVLTKLDLNLRRK